MNWARVGLGTDCLGAKSNFIFEKFTSYYFFSREKNIHMRKFDCSVHVVSSIEINSAAGNKLHNN